MSSIFTQIITGDIPCYEIYQDEICIVFLDIFPISYGHCLVVPKVEIDNWLDLDPSIYTHIQAISQQISQAIKKTIQCQRVGLMIDGRQIPHTHIHLIPLVDNTDINQKSCPPMIPQDFHQLAIDIKSNL